MNPVVAKVAIGGALIASGGLFGAAVASRPATPAATPASATEPTGDRPPVEVRTQVVHRTVREVRRVKRRKPAAAATPPAPAAAPAPVQAAATPVVQTRAPAPAPTRVRTRTSGSSGEREYEHENEVEHGDEGEHDE